MELITISFVGGITIGILLVKLLPKKTAPKMTLEQIVTEQFTAQVTSIVNKNLDGFSKATLLEKATTSYTNLLAEVQKFNEK